jgi:hypothetical protein
LKEDEQRKKIRARLQGSSIVVAFFMRPDDKEAMAQVSVPCDYEGKMTEFFGGGHGVTLKENESVNFFYYDYNYWRDEDEEGMDEWDEKLRSTRVLIYILDAQRGKIINLFHGAPQGDSAPESNYSIEFYVDESGADKGRESFALTGGLTLTAVTTFDRPKRKGGPPKITVNCLLEMGNQQLTDNVDDAYGLLYAMLESAALYE